MILSPNAPSRGITAAVVLALLALILSLVLQSHLTRAAVPYNVGDVFAGVGGGQIKHFSPTGTLLETLDNTSGSFEQTGMCFDGGGNLYSTNFSNQTMSKFDNAGNLLVHPWGGPFSNYPENCVVDAAGNIFTGEVDGDELLRKFNPAGSQLSTWSPATGPRGLDWFDLSADQCTVLYSSEGTAIHTFDICANGGLGMQGPDFATGLAAPCFALRIRANGQVLITCASQTLLLNADGTTAQTYPIAGEFLFAMNLDPDGEHFWTGGIFSGNVYRVNIATGAGTGAPLFNAGIVGGSMAGLAVFGEPTVGGPGDGDGGLSVSKRWAHTNVCFLADTVEPSECPDGVRLGVSLDTDADGDYQIAAVVGKNGMVKSYNPGQAYAVSTVEVGGAVEGLQVVEDYSDCTGGDPPLLRLNPAAGMGGGSLVVVMMVDALPVQVLDATSPEVAIADDQATVTLGELADGTTLHVYVKFAPGQKGQPFAPDSCVNHNSAQELDSAGVPVGPVVSADAVLELTAK